MKKGIAFAMALVMAVSMTACGKSKTEPTTQKTEATTEAQAEAQNLISNGDFSNGVGRWSTYTNGGSVNLTVNKEQQLQASVTKVGTLAHSVQIYLDEFALETGCQYKLSFDVAATADRTIEWRIQMNGGDYHAYVSDIVPVTGDIQHVETTFTMEEGSDPAPRLCMNLGAVEGCSEDLGEHNVVFDNFELYLLDDSNKVEAADTIEKPDININQLGYLPQDTKIAVLRGDELDDTFEVVDVATGETVYTGDVENVGRNAAAGETNGIADFTEVTKPGTYKIVGEKCGDSPEFIIGEDVYAALSTDVFKMLYLQRCGQELTTEETGNYAHLACHTTEATIYGTTKTKDVSGGWHDAGDYGRYTVSGAKAVADIMLAYEDYPTQFKDDSGIPESGNGVPDVLDEARYELEWLLKMQDETTGGVYHKVTCANFPEAVMPEEETEELILAPISNSATGDFAAVMAMAARIYKNIDADFANTCLTASKKALNYAQTNENGLGYKNPEDIVTGEYGDTNADDETFWAFAELYKTTQDKSYETAMKEYKTLSVPGGLGWQSVGYYGIYAYLTSNNQDSAYAAELKDRYDYAIDKIMENATTDSYSSTMGESYCWGSNMVIADNGMLFLMADRINQKQEYRSMAKAQLNYLLGANATSYCFVTGYGTITPKQPHHRPSQSAEAPMQGMLVGGPDSNLEDPYAKATLQHTAPANCYVDNVQSFSCNEVTVYWNSPLIYLLAGTNE